MKLPENYTLLYRNVKNVGIRVTQDQQVRIVVPQGISSEHLEDILKRRESWIQKHVQRFRMTKRPNLLTDNQLLYKGKIFILEQAKHLKRFAEIDEEQCIIRSGDHLFKKDHQTRWYRNEAKKYFEQQVRILAEDNGFQYNRITIRGQKTRWGSCSRRKNLSFNWRLIKAPPSMIDYVIFHELVHTEYLNHSKEYWRRVQSVYPEYKAAILWFKEHGRELG